MSEKVPDEGLTLNQMLNFILEAQAAGADMDQHIRNRMGFQRGAGYKLIAFEVDISTF